MAEGKKSIILYASYIHLFEALQDDEAGRLIKHIFKYVNDQDPEAPDRITQIAFEPIKQQLKRDLVSWEAIKAKRAQIGAKGGKKSAEARASKGKQKQPIASNIQANQAVTVNDNVNVKENSNTVPPEVDFLEYCKSLLQDKYLPLEFSLKAKYKAWTEANWKDGNNKQIKNWKTKISNVIPFLKPMQVSPDQKQQTTNW